MKAKGWEIEDFKAVPDELKMLNAVKITKLVRAGGSIPGIRVFEEEPIRVCPECGQERPGDERVLNGMKCRFCAY